MASNSLMPNTKLFKAGMSFISGNYQEAIELYTEIIKESPSTKNHFLYRAISYIHLKKYQNALEDLKEEEKITKESFTLLLNKGIALFYLNCLQECKEALDSGLRFAIEKEQKDMITLWINKVNIEMKEKGIIISANKGELKIIYNWIQTLSTVTIEIKANHELNEYDIIMEPKNLKFIDKKDGNIKYDMKLTNSIKPSNSHYKITGKKIEFVLEKEVVDFNWVNLEFSQPIKSEVVVGSYPSSAKAKKNWDKIDSEIEEDIKKDIKADSNDGMWKLFKDIYDRSDEKTRRAMIKSFQTSGGTVLSTNWDEVKDKDYEGKDRPEAPKGQEWAKKD